GTKRLAGRARHRAGGAPGPDGVTSGRFTGSRTAPVAVRPLLGALSAVLGRLRGRLGRGDLVVLPAGPGAALVGVLGGSVLRLALGDLAGRGVHAAPGLGGRAGARRGPRAPG